MKKINDNPITIQFTDADLEAIKKEFDTDVTKTMEEKITIDLPIITLRVILKACIEECDNFNITSQQGVSHSVSEGLEIEVLDRTVQLIERKLNEAGQDGTKLVCEVTNEVKEDIKREFGEEFYNEYFNDNVN